jgi:hypothetical protein
MMKTNSTLRPLTDAELEFVAGGRDLEYNDAVVTGTRINDFGGGGYSFSSLGALSGFTGFHHGGGAYSGQETPVDGASSWENTNDNGVLGDDGDTIVVNGSPPAGTSHWFGSLGVSLGPIGAGASYGGGQLYAYNSLGWGFTPVDVTIGYASDVDKYLGGVGVSGNGLPGSGASFDENGRLTATAWTFGTPGADASYEVNVTRGFDNAISEISRGLHNKFWRSYNLQQYDQR